tara:strand:- start:7320 stop:8015 length:696 start_codon:yes stop_codon:yes gene_type:complete
MSADGWTVGIHYFQSSGAANALCDDLNNLNANAYVVGADLSDDRAVQGMISQAAVHGPVTCLINNASIFERDDLHSVTRASWQTHMNVNLWAPLCLSQTFAAALPIGAEGNIVNIVDQRVDKISPDFLSYTISKTGLWNLTQSLALTLAPSIRVNAIGPGPVLPSPRQSNEQFSLQASRMPLGQGAPVIEIADCVRYILSTTSMTGQLIFLDGGQHLGWDLPDPGSPPITE